MGSSHSEYVGEKTSSESKKKEVDGKTPKIQRRRSIIEVRDTFGRVSSSNTKRMLEQLIYSKGDVLKRKLQFDGDEERRVHH